ncbi:MAG TPA: nuclear transport factor 2 family protein [Acidothermaceae bacterium]
MPHAHVAALEEQLRQAMLTSDLEVLDALIDPDLLFVLADGTVVDKQADVHAHRSGHVRITQLDPSDQRIDVHNSAAVVTVMMAATGSFGGVPFQGRYRYLRFWCETATGWRVVGGSMSDASQ